MQSVFFSVFGSHIKFLSYKNNATRPLVLDSDCELVIRSKI